MSTCRNCGAQLPENAAFCSTCGTPVNAQQAQSGANGAFGQQAQPGANGAFGQPQQSGMNAAPGQGMQPNPNMAYGQQMYQTPYPSGQPSGAYGYPNADLQKSKHNKKVGIIATVIILAAVIAVIGVLVFRIFSGSRGYESAVKHFVKGVQERDMQELMQAFPKEIREDFSISLRLFYDDEDEFWEEVYEDIDCGDHVKITYRIDEAEALDQEDIEDLEGSLEDEYYNEWQISEAYDLEITLVCKGSEGTDEDSAYLTVAKIGGHWYVVDM